MKKLTALCLTICLLVAMAVPAVAAETSNWTIRPGDEIRVDDFTTDGNFNETLPYALTNSNYSLGFRVTGGGGAYVSSVYIDDSTNDVVVKLKGGAGLTKEKLFTVVITLKDKEPRGKRYVHEMTVDLQSMDVENMEPSDGRSLYTLPSNYQTCITRFRDPNDSEGSKQVYKFRADFSDKALFETKVIGQDNLYLGYVTTSDVAMMKKYGNANLRFIKWADSPKFGIAGNLTIKSEKSEYVYRILNDGSLQTFGTYNASNNGYTAKTDTLGAYVISNIALGASAMPSAPSTPAEPTSPTVPTGEYSGKNPNTGR